MKNNIKFDSFQSYFPGIAINPINTVSGSAYKHKEGLLDTVWNQKVRRWYRPPCNRWGCSGKREIREKGKFPFRPFGDKIHQLQRANGKRGVIFGKLE